MAKVKSKAKPSRSRRTGKTAQKTTLKPVRRVAAKRAKTTKPPKVAKTAKKAVARKPGKSTKPLKRAGKARLVKARRPVKVVIKAKRPKKITSIFKKKDLAKFRALLEDEHDRLQLELDEIEARAARALEIEAAGEIGDYDDHDAADTAAETFEREKDLAIGENLSSILSKIRNALAKIERGTYGICDICGGPIKRARLEAIPFATLCVNCQGRIEAGQ